MPAFRCFSCNKVVPIFEGVADKCPSCGTTNGEIISNERLKEGMEAGVFSNIDPNTGKREKNSK